MEIRINDGDKIAIVGSKGKFGSYIIVEGLDGGAVTRTDASRDIFDESKRLKCCTKGCNNNRFGKNAYCVECKAIHDAKAQTQAESKDSI